MTWLSRPLFFTTVLHDIYHTPFDEPSRIEYPKLTRIAKWMGSPLIPSRTL